MFQWKILRLFFCRKLLKFLVLPLPHIKSGTSDTPYQPDTFGKLIWL